jgi:hypothetical protein
MVMKGRKGQCWDLQIGSAAAMIKTGGIVVLPRRPLLAR